MGRKTSVEWSSITDQTERRRAQNRLAQRMKRQRDTERDALESSLPFISSPDVSITSQGEESGLVEGSAKQRETSEPFPVGTQATETEDTNSQYLLYQPDQLILNDFDLTLQKEMYLGDYNLPTGGNVSQISSAGASPNFQWPSITELEEATIKEDSRRGLTTSEVSTAPGQQGISKEHRNAAPIDNLTRGPKSSSALHQELGKQIPGSAVGLRDLENAETLQDEGALEERMCKMVSTARAMGFESLDSLMLQYYTLPVRENISLLETQSRSRRRGLPNLVLLLSYAFLAWPQRESQGIVEALLTSVEHVIRGEAQIYTAEHSSKDQHEDTELREDSKSTVESLRADLPNTWTLLYEIAALFLSSEQEASDFVRAAMARLVLEEQ